LISGGFDGYVKFWDINRFSLPIFQINFSNRQIYNIKSNSCFCKIPLIFVGLDNGFFSCVSLIENSEVSVKFHHQGNLGNIGFFSNKIFSVGQEGDLVIVDIISPLKNENNNLNLNFLQKKFLIEKKKQNFRNYFLQSIDNKFSTQILEITPFFRTRFLLKIAGKAGVLFFFNYKILKITEQKN
jgi:hypothetical protein